MAINVKNIGISRSKGFNGSQFIITFKPTYQYKATVLAYDEFDFIVDSGSSLGLWIGKELQLLKVL